MKQKRVLIDCFTGRIYLVGPGGYELKLSPGSEVYDLHESKMGHLMLPCCKNDHKARRSKEAMSFVVGNTEGSARAPASRVPRLVEQLRHQPQRFDIATPRDDISTKIVPDNSWRADR